MKQNYIFMVQLHRLIIVGDIMENKDLEKNKSSIKYTVFKYILFIVIPIIAFYIMEAYEHNPFEDVRVMAQFFNILIFELIAWTLFVTIGRAAIALDITLICAMIFGLINHYVMAFRSTPFVPWDIYSVKTAKSVVAGYDFTPESRVILVTLVFIILIIISSFIRIKMDIKKIIRGSMTAVLLLVMYIFAGALQNEQFQLDNYLYPFLFTPAYMTKVNGMAVTFTMDLAYLKVDKPNDYNKQEIEKILEEYASKETSGENLKQTPNIIVIMDEAFSDLSVLGDFSTNEDYMPFIHSLQQGNENTVTGYVNVSVCGGNTADSEFEFLTGNTMAFLPTGSIPYQQYIKSPTPSIAGSLKDLGYETYAQHPYYASGWCRENVYPLLGFDNLDFIQNYVNRKIYRDYISDETCFNKIISTYEQKKPEKPAFIFSVTMQNHGSYSDTYENFFNTITADKLNNSSLDQYLTLLKITDAEFEKLINYFENEDEDTIIVFFGDHQPNDAVAYSVLSENGLDYKNLNDEELKLRYKVPYVIWANFDIEEGSDVETSLNYLGAHVLKLANIETSDYQNFLLELEKYYPVISSVNITENEENEHMMELYKKIQYYKLFDQKGN